MIIDCISDLHGYYPKLEGGDLLIIAGDFNGNDSWDEYLCFQRWLNEQKYQKIILVAGNHDTICQDSDVVNDLLYEHTYLQDSGTEFEGLKIWGSPWTKSFPGMNPKCKAFTVDTEEELAEKWELIPDDVDILVTHSPARGIFDKVFIDGDPLSWNVGSASLSRWVGNHAQTLKLHVHGHIHGCYGIWDVRAAKQMCGDTIPSPVIVNASHVNDCFDPVNKPIRIELDTKAFS